MTQQTTKKKASKFDKLKDKPELWKFVKFNLTVVVTSLLDLAVYSFFLYVVFRHLRTTPVPDNDFLNFLGIKYTAYLYSYAISTTSGYVAAYLINRKITFQSDVNAAQSATLYAIMATVTVIFSTWLGSVVGAYLVDHNMSNAVTELIAKLIVINVPTIFTYPLERFVIQRQVKHKGLRPKMLSIDLDGTTLTTDGDITKENIKGIKKACRKGIMVVPTTGRTFYEIPQQIRDISNIKYYIYSNGATICDKKGKVIFTNHIDIEEAKQIFELISLYDSMPEIYAHGRPYLDKSQYGDDAYEYFNIDPDYRPVLNETRHTKDNLKEFLYSLDDIEMYNIFFKNIEQRDECAIALKLNYPNLHITMSMDNNIEVLQATATKGNSIKEFCKIKNINPKEVAAMGDSKNDFEMFKAVGHTFAVANACKELKMVAKKIAPSNDENAVNFVIENYLI